MNCPAATPAELDLLTGFLRLHSEDGAPPTPYWISADTLPETVRRLLAHDHGMTATLEAFWGERMRLTVLHTAEEATSLRRHVLLSGADSGTPAELGLIEMYLEALPLAALFAVRQRRIPFGAILSACGVSFRSQPAGFLTLVADDGIARLLRLRPGDIVHGRATTLYDMEDRMLATAVELLSGHHPR
ncbi:hypothetical protein GE253_20105 [Niveispirillum sp. SYP-B3756]|uniref:hypothetical protein n=1 Tax=Niveispirillum sp. SYP-B3756 TaxID=2662178 RepID=UPI001290BD08|nr:hypothetical protein [Niveispirillum sp. SYP-B3756]MQP67635.1 hypothetical protein [Niveispirillum sp. SYP-B3756]